jgi:predicted permease
MVFLAQRTPAALANVREWKRQSRSFEDLTPFAGLSCNLGGGSASDRPSRVEAIQVEPGFFGLLGIRPAIGRAFTDGDAKADRAILLSAGAYRRRFGGDTNLAGKTVRVNGVERSIVGVLPDGFELPAMWEGFDQRKPDVWLPFDPGSLNSEQQLWGRNYFVYGRLRPGATLAEARTEMDVIGKRLQSAFPEQNKGFGVNVFSLATEDVGPDLRRSIYVLQVAVGFVLLIACANVANLLLARAVAREREIAIRLALGASRGQIVRLMLTESLLLGAMGGVLGIVLGYWSLGAISALAPKDTHGFHELRLDWLVLAFSFALSLSTGLIFGLAPAAHAGRRNLNASLGHGARISGGPQWMRNGMAIAEVALALILLVGAGLMIRTLSALMSVDPGFRADHLVTMQTSLTNTADPERARAFSSQLLERVRQIPGVISVSLSSGLPMESVSESSYEIDGAPETKEFRIAGVTRITETYFSTLGIPIRRGRDFTQAEAEAKQPGVAVVSEAFARLNWPNQDALGKVIRTSGFRLRVIGVIGGVHQMGPDAEVRPEIYLPSRSYEEVNLAARTAGDPMALAPALEKAVWSIDPDQPVQQVRSMQKVLRDWPEERRFYMTILGVFAGLALTLASLGLYGVLAYVVNLRMRELGIRMALGANARQVLGLVLGQGLRLAAIGIGAGLVGAWWLTRVMKSLVFGVGTSDPATFATVAALVGMVAMVAAFVSARRAASVDPVEALRTE